MDLALPNDAPRSFDTAETPSTISSVHTPPTCYKDEALAIEESSELNDTIGGCLASGLPMRLQHPLDASTLQAYQPYPSYMAPTMLATNFCELLAFNGVGIATKDLELA
ncbi:hypothetical protein Purlil1_13294 [Purpureocillium lilacinum]|uniref:Uncharacterized protein n=1 Tax=Purpureocillium lilacinum TaxID=33203 RepID=A0ABR0BEI3_PURLI|nr:hypothetical protein Purlil1_13294 [Purpureocillium lilacinum]